MTASVEAILINLFLICTFYFIFLIYFTNSSKESLNISLSSYLAIIFKKVLLLISKKRNQIVTKNIGIRKGDCAGRLQSFSKRIFVHSHDYRSTLLSFRPTGASQVTRFEVLLHCQWTME